MKNAENHVQQILRQIGVDFEEGGEHS
jgi:hypothetical protein